MSTKISIESVKHKSLKLRIYPNTNQEILINKTFGCCRQIYNFHLQEKNEFYIDNILPVKNKITQDEKLKIYKTFKPKTEKELKVQFPYFSEVSSVALQQSRRNCDNAFLNFFKSKNGSRKGKMNFPKFKSKKDNHQSYKEVNVNNNCQIKYDNKELKIPKLGIVKFKNRDKPKWFKNIKKLNSLTVEKSCSGKYFVSILFEVESQNFEKIENRKESIGLDFSPSELYVDSEGNNGIKYGYKPQKQTNAKKLKKLQRRFAKKTYIFNEKSNRKIPSKNRVKARIKLARLEERIANCQKDFIEKETLRLVKSYNKVVVEDLNLKGISKFLTNAKNMNDTSWGTFVSRLEEKGKEYNCQIIKADRLYPSSQLCSVCGFQNHNLKLSDRVWTCPNCKTKLIRDINAAINLKNYDRISWEVRKSKSVENLEGLVEQALQNPENSKKQKDSQATTIKNPLSL